MDVLDVPVGPSTTAFLHTIVGGPPSSSPPIVMMPGYAAGTGFFYRNFESLCSRFRVYSVDWLGTGLSGRPKYTAQTTDEAEEFFLSSLAKWRQEMGMDTKMILVGHSLGGYLAASYALRHPEHVQHLVLVCPAGVPQAPDDWMNKYLGDHFSWRKQAFKVFGSLWASGFTPGSLVRGMGPWGPGIVEKYVANRFNHHGDGLTKEEAGVFGDYFYSIAAGKGSGEYALRHLLAPGAWAHTPLQHSLSGLKVPVTFIYGAHDWMRPAYAVDLCGSLLEGGQVPKTANDLTVEIIPDAGHFAFLDQPELFNASLHKICEAYMSEANRTKFPPSKDDGTGFKRSTSFGSDALGSDSPVPKVIRVVPHADGSQPDVVVLNSTGSEEGVPAPTR
ncbi:MAG: hypothetical protein WDW36_007503 [Sanguina aurantia]